DWQYPEQWENNQLAASSDPKVVDTVSVGDKASDDYRLSSGPVIADGMLFTVDGQGKATARNAANPSTVVWSFELPSVATGKWAGIHFGDKSGFQGANIAYGGSLVFITTGTGQVFAVDAKTGKEIWERDIKAPIRSAPVAVGGAVYFTTLDNQLFALDISS